ncbi:MAG: hypothetical protein MUP47_08405 [Phycisphaerae bacterium]|nr:hypothetical protein [Phycisphaerae bacterium]
MEVRVKEWSRGATSTTWYHWCGLVGLVVGVPLLILLPLVVAGLVFLPPPQYDPAHLDYEARSVAAKQFYRQMMDFDDLAQSNVPFEFTFTAEQLNRYLASVDEIAALLPEGQAGRVQEMMLAAHLRGPAVALKGGRLMLMVQTGKHGLVVSAELLPALDRRGKLVVRLGALRVGRLHVPQALIRGSIDSTKNRLLLLRASQRQETDVPGGPAQADVGDVAANYAMRMVVGALDGQPIEPEGKYRHHRIRLTGIDITPGQITVHIVPVPKKPTQPADSQASTQPPPASALSR